MHKITKRTAAIVTAAVLGVGALGATAWANGWFKSDATATVSTAKAAEIKGTVTFGSQLAPTGSSDITLNFANPNSYKVRITGLKLAGEIGDKTGCTADNAGITFDNPDFVVPAATKFATKTVTGGAHMNQYAADACEGLEKVTATVILTGAVAS